MQRRVGNLVCAAAARECRACGHTAQRTHTAPPPHRRPTHAQDKEERTWAALFVDACRYAWPEAWHLRVRVAGCVGLLISMRFLNLAVPIFYKVRAGRGPRRFSKYVLAAGLRDRRRCVPR